VDRRSPHEVLGIGADASPEEIRSAFHREALRWHPDRNPDDPSAEARFKAAAAAYEQLRDGGRRRADDRAAYHQAGFPGFGFGSGFGRGFGFGRGRGCGRGWRRGQGCGRWSRPDAWWARGGRGLPHERQIRLTLSADEARAGCEKKIQLESASGRTVLTFRLPPDLEHGDVVRLDGLTREGAPILGREIYLQIAVEPPA
jgi:molecular chaperone DnaJ